MTSMSPYLQATHVKSFPSIEYAVWKYPVHTLFTTSLTSMIDQCHIVEYKSDNVEQIVETVEDLPEE